jgi:uncharacterized protein (DUF488 family)
MTDRVYTIGYSGRKPAEILEIARDLDATVFDVRFSPRSRVPHWTRGRLEALLGDRYRHVRALGNRNYRGGPTDLVDFPAGLELIRESNRPVILMCACKDPAFCHRSTIAEKLRRAGMEVTELNESRPVRYQQLELI